MIFSFKRKAILSFAAAATMAGALAASPTAAQAGCWNCGYGYGYGHHRGGAVAAGVIGGLALGAIAAHSYRPVYGAPVYAGPDCFVRRERVRTAYGTRLVRRTVCY